MKQKILEKQLEFPFIEEAKLEEIERKKRDREATLGALIGGALIIGILYLQSLPTPSTNPSQEQLPNYSEINNYKQNNIR